MDKKRVEWGNKLVNWVIIMNKGEGMAQKELRFDGGRISWKDYDK